MTMLFLKKEQREREARQSKQRGAEGWESHAWRGEPLLILTKARQERRAELRRAAGLLHHQPTVGSRLV